jgi:hypothetical protein
MPSVYDTDAFAQRVKYAVQCITLGRFHTRHFDTAFEMSDGDAVAVAVYRRSLKNKKLAANIWKGLGKDSVMQAVERLKDVPTHKLAEAARMEREENQRRRARQAEAAEREECNAAAAAHSNPADEADALATQTEASNFPLFSALEQNERESKAQAG